MASIAPPSPSEYTTHLPLPPDESEMEEFDELDSDSDMSESGAQGSASTRKSTTRPSGQRIPGNSLLPAMRIENILQADGNTGSLALSKEGLFILSTATEEFIKRMAQAGQRQAATERRNVVTYRDMASTTQQYQEFMFLQDTVPSSMTLSQALLRRDLKEKELLEDDPAMMSATMPIYTAPASHAVAARRRLRPSNGLAQANGSTSSSTRENSAHESGGVLDKGQWYGNPVLRDDAPADVHWSADWQETGYVPPRTNGLAPTRHSVPLPSNGHDVPYDRARTTPAVPNYLMEASLPGPGQAGPIGFLQPLFGRPQNTGRTIYSHQHHPE